MAAKQGLESIIADLPLFRDLGPHNLELIAGCASNVRFQDGQYIFREGEEANVFYVIRHGQVSIDVFAPQRGAVTIQTLEEGDVLSWSWLFPPYRTMFDARCLTLVRALAFDGACLRGKCEEDHALGFEFMKRFARVMTERLRATRLQLLDVYGTSSHA
jgi:CRP-like cAMP-binding protein